MDPNLKNQNNNEYNTLLKCVPYQLCPKCNGQGQVSKPPYIAGDVHQWSSSGTIFPCDVCNGSKIIPMFIVSHGDVKEIPIVPTPEP